MRYYCPNDLSLRVGSDVVTPVNAVRDLGVTLDFELTMRRHVNKVAATSGFRFLMHLIHISQAPSYLTDIVVQTAETVWQQSLL